eukprot:5759920-Pyramimonas_sp.AAC.1
MAPKGKEEGEVDKVCGAAPSGCGTRRRVWALSNYRGDRRRQLETLWHASNGGPVSHRHHHK